MDTNKKAIKPLSMLQKNDDKSQQVGAEKSDKMPAFNSSSSNNSAQARKQLGQGRLLEKRQQLDRLEEQQALTLRALKHTKTGDMLDAFFASQKAGDVTAHAANQSGDGVVSYTAATSGDQDILPRSPQVSRNSFQSNSDIY